MNNDTLGRTARTPPVLLLTFSRPNNAATVLERIREANPPAIYVACDGPRAGRDDDVANIRAIHEMVGRIDWCGNVKTLFRERNLGCRRAVSEAITWFLNETGEGIILEDDCLPDLTFFPFCSEMLERYRSASNVMCVSGFNLACDAYQMKWDYVFSNLGWQWGWATWQRAWQVYDPAMSTWPLFKRMRCHKQFPFNPARVAVWDDVHAGKYDSWAYPWQYSIAANSGMSVVPRVSLIKNIGFGAGATHCTDANGSARYQLPVRPLSFPLRHCEILRPDPGYDKLLLGILTKESLSDTLRRPLSRLYHRIRPT